MDLNQLTILLERAAAGVAQSQSKTAVATQRPTITIGDIPYTFVINLKKGDTPTQADIKSAFPEGIHFSNEAKDGRGNALPDHYAVYIDESKISRSEFYAFMSEDHNAKSRDKASLIAEA